MSFDHYFGTYPAATNPRANRRSTPSPATPTINGLSGALLTNNPNLSNPQRLDRDQALTCDQDHAYTAEQQAFDHGLMDKFVQNTGPSRGCSSRWPNAWRTWATTAPVTGPSPNYAVMDYYDGNTVTALWNYAQHFAMSDNSYGTTFGPSTPGALNVTAAQTLRCPLRPVLCGVHRLRLQRRPSSPHWRRRWCQPGPGTVYSDADPLYDICSSTQDGNTAAKEIAMGGPEHRHRSRRRRRHLGMVPGRLRQPGLRPRPAEAATTSRRCARHAQEHRRRVG